MTLPYQVLPTRARISTHSSQTNLLRQKYTINTQQNKHVFLKYQMTRPKYNDHTTIITYCFRTIEENNITFCQYSSLICLHDSSWVPRATHWTMSIMPKIRTPSWFSLPFLFTFIDRLNWNYGCWKNWNNYSSNYFWTFIIEPIDDSEANIP